MMVDWFIEVWIMGTEGGLTRNGVFCIDHTEHLFESQGLGDVRVCPWMSVFVLHAQSFGAKPRIEN